LGPYGSTFSIQNCTGAVHLHQVSITATGQSGFPLVNVVQSSPRVAFSNCSLSGVALTNSSATFSSCTVQGTRGFNGGYPTVSPGQGGLALGGKSRAFLIDCTIAGGNGDAPLS